MTKSLALFYTIFQKFFYCWHPWCAKWRGKEMPLHFASLQCMQAVERIITVFLKFCQFYMMRNFFNLNKRRPLLSISSLVVCECVAHSSVHACNTPYNTYAYVAENIFVAHMWRKCVHMTVPQTEECKNVVHNFTCLMDKSITNKMSVRRRRRRK